MSGDASLVEALAADQRARASARLRRAAAHPLVQEAAAVAITFHLDPAAVMAETDPLKALVRLAATRFVQDEQEKAEAKARRSR